MANRVRLPLFSSAQFIVAFLPMSLSVSCHNSSQFCAGGGEIAREIAAIF